MSSSLSILRIWDYVTCSILVVMASSVGIYHVFASRNTRNMTEFLVKSHDLGMVPLILSAAATFTSAITFLGVPVETYANGVNFMAASISVFLIIPPGAFLYLPVFYNLEISSIFEYLEVRFSRGVRLCASTLINFQVMLFTSCAIYAPALALNQVTGLHLWASVASVGIICIIYTSLGGIKAVVWADATQVVVMIAVLLLITIKGTRDLGGLAEIWRICTEGKREQFFIFTNSPYSMYTFWTLIIGGTVHFMATLVTNQLMVQRYVSNKTLREAKISFIGGTFITNFLFTCTSLGGLIMYARYHDCDPLISGQVTSRDQIMALFSMETLGFCTGLPGVFIAAILCATISTLSSALNSLSTITMEDYIKPSFPMLSQKNQMWLSKILALLYGAVCMALVFVAQSIAGLMKALFIINGVFGGPVLAIFTVGMAFPWGAMSGFFAGLLLTGWASVGALVMNPLMPAAPYSISGCNISDEWLTFNQSEVIYDNIQFASTKDTPMTSQSDVFVLYTIPSLWYACWSCGIAIVVSNIVSILTGPNKVDDVDPKLLFPGVKTLCGLLPKKCQEVLGHEAGNKSYLQIAMTDAENYLGQNQRNTNHQANGTLPEYSDAVMKNTY